MPFSFKPTQEASQPDTPSSMPLGQNLMSRIPESATSLFDLMLYVVAAGCIIVTLFLFVYRSYLISQVAVKKNILATYEKKLGSFPLAEMQRLSNRFKVLAPLLKDHPSVNAAFKILEDSVENPLTYTRFNLRLDEASKSYILSLSASSPDYKSAIQQLDTFKGKPYTSYIGPVTIEGLRPDETGRIQLTMKMPLLIKGILPENLLLGGILNNVGYGPNDQMMVGVGTSSAVEIPTTIVSTTTTTTTSSSTRGKSPSSGTTINTAPLGAPN